MSIGKACSGPRAGGRTISWAGDPGKSRSWGLVIEELRFWGLLIEVILYVQASNTNEAAMLQTYKSVLSGACGVCRKNQP